MNERQLIHELAELHDRILRNVRADPSLTYDEEADRVIADFAAEHPRKGLDVQQFYRKVLNEFLRDRPEAEDEL